MGSKSRIWLVAMLLIAGIAVMAYPAVSNYINTIHNSRAVQNLSEQLQNMDAQELDRQHSLARRYNDALRGVEEGKILAQYEQIMDFGNGIMAVIQIPKIGVELSVYHGTSDAVLQKGVGHVPTSAFPIGGAGNHTVLTGHTGLPSAELFTDLTELAVGDQFYIQVLNETLAYEVDQITVVLPYEVDGLQAVAGKDYCTLVTCTPYGVNSHRLLVRGVRVSDDQQGGDV